MAISLKVAEGLVPGGRAVVVALSDLYLQKQLSFNRVIQVLLDHSSPLVFVVASLLVLAVLLWIVVQPLVHLFYYVSLRTICCLKRGERRTGPAPSSPVGSVKSRREFQTELERANFCSRLNRYLLYASTVACIVLLGFVLQASKDATSGVIKLGDVQNNTVTLLDTRYSRVVKAMESMKNFSVPLAQNITSHSDIVSITENLTRLVNQLKYEQKSIDKERNDLMSTLAQMRHNMSDICSDMNGGNLCDDVEAQFDKLEDSLQKTRVKVSLPNVQRWNGDFRIYITNQIQQSVNNTDLNSQETKEQLENFLNRTKSEIDKFLNLADDLDENRGFFTFLVMFLTVLFLLTTIAFSSMAAPLVYPVIQFGYVHLLTIVIGFAAIYVLVASLISASFCRELSYIQSTPFSGNVTSDSQSFSYYEQRLQVAWHTCRKNGGSLYQVLNQFSNKDAETLSASLNKTLQEKRNFTDCNREDSFYQNSIVPILNKLDEGSAKIETVTKTMNDEIYDKKLFTKDDEVYENLLTINETIGEREDLSNVMNTWLEQYNVVMNISASLKNLNVSLAEIESLLSINAIEKIQNNLWDVAIDSILSESQFKLKSIDNCTVFFKLAQRFSNRICHDFTLGMTRIMFLGLFFVLFSLVAYGASVAMSFWLKKIVSLLDTQSSSSEPNISSRQTISFSRT